MTRARAGQSTLEYIILVTAVIVVILGYVGSTTGGFQKTLNSTLSNAATKMPNTIKNWDLPSGN